jgi:hypothetical protein
MVMVVGAAGAFSFVLVNFNALGRLFPQLDRYCNLMLSPVTAAALLLKLTTILCEFSLPESIKANSLKLPTNDHKYPVAGSMVEFELFVPDGNAGAVNRYRLFEQMLAPIFVTVIVAGAVGTDNFMLVNLRAAYLLAHPFDDLTFILSVINAASLEVYLTKSVLELLMSPESTVTPETPPIEVGKIQLYVVPTGATDAVYLYTLELHTLLTTV